MTSKKINTGYIIKMSTEANPSLVNINRDKINKRCYELDNQLNDLFVFSSKLKHLQLCYEFYIQSVSKMEQRLKTQKNDVDDMNEYDVMQIERSILELLTHICSIRDSLRNKVLDTGTKSVPNGREKYNGMLMLVDIPELKDFKNTDIILAVDISTGIRHLYHCNKEVLRIDITTREKNMLRLEDIKSDEEFCVKLNKHKTMFISKRILSMGRIQQSSLNGNLCQKYMKINHEHRKILDDTLDKDEKSKHLISLTNKLRNILYHNTNQKTQFLVREFCPQFGAKRVHIFLVCDYLHLIGKLDDISEETAVDLTWRYFLDDHLICIKNGILNSNGTQYGEFARRSGILDNSVSLIELHNNLYNRETSRILLPKYRRIELEQEYYINENIKFFDNKVLTNKAYCMFSYNEYKDGNDFNRRLVKMFFNLRDVVKDIYMLYYEYYTKLHTLLGEEYEADIKEFGELMTQLGFQAFINTGYQRKYSCNTPVNPHDMV